MDQAEQLSRPLHERVAVLETQMTRVETLLTHLDACMDSLKATIWKASGALGVVIWAVETFLRK